MDLSRQQHLRGSSHGLSAHATGSLAAATSATVTAAHGLNRAAGMLASSVLIDSAMEHYRGQFNNPAMWTPLLASSLSIAASLHGHLDPKHGAHRVRNTIYTTAGLIGLVGTGFHLYNVTKQVGGFSWQNVFYRAPLGAPAALSLSGLMGYLSERLRDNPPDRTPMIAGTDAGRTIAALTGVALLGTTAEAGLLHFRGAFHNPAMWLPVTMPPIAAALLALAAAGPRGLERPASHQWMAATAVMGIAGVALHAWGVSRGMGGWNNWRQNAFAGPPIPAPPAFTGLALAGLAALALLAKEPS